MDTINKHTAIRKTPMGSTVAVTIERGTWDETISADGWDTGIVKTHIVNRTTITLRDVAGKTLASSDRVTPMSAAKVLSPKSYPDAVKAGCVGMVGAAYIKHAVLDLITDAQTEADAASPKTARQIEIETAEANRKAAHEAWLASPEGKADTAAWERHERLMRQMDRADSDL